MKAFDNVPLLQAPLQFFSSLAKELELFSSAKSTRDLLIVDLLKKANLKSLHEIEVGYGARRSLHVSSVPKQSEKRC